MSPASVHVDFWQLVSQAKGLIAQNLELLSSNGLNPFNNNKIQIEKPLNMLNHWISSLWLLWSLCIVLLTLSCEHCQKASYYCRYQTSRCPFGDKCTQAHSEAELEEWQERLAFRKQQLQKARDNQLHGNTFTERLLEKLTNPEGPKVGVSVLFNDVIH